MGSDPDQMRSSQSLPASPPSEAPPRAGEDELLGVIADVERQLESLKSHRAEREGFRHKLEEREKDLEQRHREISQRDTELAERAAAVSSEGHRLAERARETEAAEAELARRRDKLEHDFAALAEEQRRATDAAAKEAAELKAMSVALEQREHRLAEHAASISRQRETFESVAAELAKREESAAAAAAELQESRREVQYLKQSLDQSEREGAARIAQLDQVTKHAAESEHHLSELTRSTDEARARYEDQHSKLSEQLRIAKDEIKRAGEAQSALMAELALRDKTVEDTRKEADLIKAEAARRQVGITDAETRIADYKRQLIDRDSRIQDLSTKLAAATSKFREVSQTLQEQASLAEQAQALHDELRQRDQTITELKARAETGGDSTVAKADLEALEQQLQQMRTQLQESRTANRDLKAQLSEAGSDAASGGGVPEDVGEAIVTRWRRLRLMRNMLQEQGAKLQQASEAVRQRFDQAEQVLAQRDQLAQARASIATVHEKLQRLQAGAAAGKAAVAVFYLVGALAGLAGLSWAVSGEVAPAKYAARAIINADTKGRQTSDEQLVEWQKYIESELKDPRFQDAAAERMTRVGIVSLSTPGQLAQRMEADLIAESGVAGTLKIELKGDGRAKTVRELDTLVTALVSQANATKERRADGLGVLIAEKPNADAGPIESNRMTYALATFGVGAVLCLGLGSVTYQRLSKAKVRIEEEQQIDSILEDSNWKRAEKLMREGRG